MGLKEKLKLFYLRWKYRNASRELIIERTLEGADKMIDSLEKSWSYRPDNLPLEEQEKLQDAIEEAKELRRRLAEELGENDKSAG